ncbi:TPA: hypothetical protein ACIBVD_001741 [Salmonella enterica subsp. enterica serovar Javiana]
MKQWKYIKGSEKDFEGAPDWAVIAWNRPGVNTMFMEGLNVGDRFQPLNSNNTYKIKNHSYLPNPEYVTAERQLMGE